MNAKLIMFSQKAWTMQNPEDEPTRTLHEFLQKDIEPLQGIIRSYVIRAGLARGEAVQSVTLDILSEATLQALEQLELFAPVRQPRAWFLGIAATVVKRRRLNIAILIPSSLS